MKNIASIDNLPRYLLQAAFLLRVYFDHEDGGDMFFRKVGLLLADYTAFYSRR
jgi:hypothetical protein